MDGVYKIVTKALARRSTKVIGNAIGENQHAFELGWGGGEGVENTNP